MEKEEKRGRETPEGEGRAAESGNRGCQQCSQSHRGRAPVQPLAKVSWSLRSLPPLPIHSRALLQVLATTPLHHNWRRMHWPGGVARRRQAQFLPELFVAGTRSFDVPVSHLLCTVGESSPSPGHGIT
jgi:hypothetical protein